MTESKHSITFTNEFTIPVQIETWQSTGQGISSFVSKIVGCEETIQMESDTGEWFVNNYIIDKNINRQWEDAGYKLGVDFCKFRDAKCILGNYYWLHDDAFELIVDIQNNSYVFTPAKIKNENKLFTLLDA